MTDESPTAVSAAGAGHDLWSLDGFTNLDIAEDLRRMTIRQRRAFWLGFTLGRADVLDRQTARREAQRRLR